jgi:hypothetical protein
MIIIWQTQVRKAELLLDLSASQRRRRLRKRTIWDQVFTKQTLKLFSEGPLMAPFLLYQSVERRKTLDWDQVATISLQASTRLRARELLWESSIDQELQLRRL